MFILNHEYSYTQVLIGLAGSVGLASNGYTRNGQDRLKKVYNIYSVQGRLH